MPRYRIGETPETGADHLTENLQIGAAVFGLMTGIGFVYAGLRAKQYWLAIWGAGLVIASLIYLGYQLIWSPT
jgi:hypothetical protein